MCNFVPGVLSYPSLRERGKKRVVERTWEKYHQISRSGPWSATYDFGRLSTDKRSLKDVLKIYSMHFYEFSFLDISITYRVFSNYL